MTSHWWTPQLMRNYEIIATYPVIVADCDFGLKSFLPPNLAVRRFAGAHSGVQMSVDHMGGTWT
ncbi:hypothetical protein E2C01_040916 [Portunus trituberculatus]|uniref:Uncharacterized protein n=1 Tax=Portunus trituberculatus TaxID=210409 RepID=A0A5B7FPI1_PORTR|nr:hypothetical protein [Portunus trituberculatus]